MSTLATARNCGFALLVYLLSAGCAPARGTIGALLAQDASGRLIIREAPESLAAGRAGLYPGDEILLIDGRDVRTLDSKQLHQALSGEVDDPVKLTVVRGDRVLRVALRRTPARRGSQPQG